MLKLNQIQGVIFDLDGVLVDTARFHYLAWSRLADELGFTFTIEDNERLKGVSRMESLEILLGIGNLQDSFTEDEKKEMAEKKNKWYAAYLDQLSEKDILGDGKNYIKMLKKRGMKIGLGSSSKNAKKILHHLEIYDLFDGTGSQTAR